MIFFVLTVWCSDRMSLKIIIEVFGYKFDRCVSLPESAGVFISIHCRALDCVFAAKLKRIIFCPVLT